MDIGALIDAVTDVLRSLVATPPTAYIVVFAMAAIDVVFPIIPSEAIVLLAAVAAGTGELDVVLVAVAAALGAFLGDNLAYLIGRSMGRPLMERILGDRMDRLGWVETRLQRHGPSLIIVGRFVPGGRSLVAIGSGVMRMPWATFAAYDAIAVTIWSLQVVIPGYIGGSLFTEQPWLGFIVGAVISAGGRWPRSKGSAGSTAGGEVRPSRSTWRTACRSSWTGSANACPGGRPPRPGMVPMTTRGAVPGSRPEPARQSSGDRRSTPAFKTRSPIRVLGLARLDMPARTSKTSRSTRATTSRPSKRTSSSSLRYKLRWSMLQPPMSTWSSMVATLAWAISG